MNDLIKKLVTHMKTLWGKWSMLQRLILVGIAVAVLVGVVALFGVSSSPSYVPVIDAPISDEAARYRIQMRINEEGVRTIVTPAGVVQVADESTARRMRAILIREDLIPTGTDPWAIFDRERWTLTDFERNVNFRRAHTQMITDHIKAIDDVDDVNVVVEVPATELFASNQKPISASVIIFPKPGSDIIANRKKIEGIQKLLKMAIAGLSDENIVITDQSGNQLNDFAGLAAWDRQTLIEREQKFIQAQEAQYRAKMLTALQHTFSADRVRDLNVKFEIDMSEKTVDTKESFPVTIRPRTPGLSYDDSEWRESILVSESATETIWEGTGYNPEGPAGVEGQTPPAFKDLQNLYGRMTQSTRTHNQEINQRHIQEVRSPQIDRVTVAVNIDGKWKRKYDEKGQPIMMPDGSIEREYTPISMEDLRNVQLLIQDAIGYNLARSDSVTVRNIPFDRTKEFHDEDEAFLRQKQIQTTIIVIISGLTLLLVGFIIFRIIAREMERRRRAAEEERARREQALRESAMLEAEQEGVDVSISVEERTRMELMESVVNLAKEHPEDCAQLIRTWLLEE
ncbi:MAG: flagellar M-ring protein FliF [Treponema sp.]|nr:flagellar M-ring protein FliF [Treponema sp.]